MEKPIYRERRNTNCVKWDVLERKYNDPDLLSMWIADMDFAVPECVRDALREYVDFGVFGYFLAPGQYTEEYLEWQERRHGVRPQKEWLRFVQGGLTGIYLSISAYTSPGDKVACLTPAYPPFMAAPEALGRHSVTCPLINDRGYYSIDYSALENLFSEESPEMFIWCSPHNPTGRVWKEEELLKVLELCRKYNVIMLSDEVHQDLCQPGFVHVPVYAFENYHDLTVCMNSPAKTFNLAACQSATFIIPDETLQAKMDSAILAAGKPAPSAFSQIAYQTAYAGGDEWLDSLLKVVGTNSSIFRKILKEAAPEIVISPQEGTYLLWVDLSAYIPSGEISEFVQNECHLALNLGSEFGGEEYGSFVRINMATSQENVSAAAESIVRALGKRK